ncbi:MAG: lysophospholipid acyltransferase family protein [bacterium]
MQKNQPQELQTLYPRRGIFYEAIRAIWVFFYKVAGWKFGGGLPEDVPKFVIIAAPHTSNWDFPIALTYAFYWRFDVKFMGKKSLFDGPLGWFFRACGGIPIDRSKNHDLVSQMVDVFEKEEQLIVAVPPEGTRSKVDKWKTGFYHIAVGANVPIALGYFDYDTKEVGIGQIYTPCGILEKDMAEIQNFYATITPKHPEKYRQYDISG